MIGPFERESGAVLGADPELTFDCPVGGADVAWAAKDVFNPGAVVHDGRVHLLVRAEDDDGRYAGVSRIGLATSDDGVHFELEPEPVLFPDDDEWQAWEWPGGCEDPRVVESPDGGFVCTYTAFDGKNGSLFVATSADLRTWRKHGPAFAGTPHAKRTSKSGSIVTEVRRRPPRRRPPGRRPVLDVLGRGHLLARPRPTTWCAGRRSSTTPPATGTSPTTRRPQRLGPRAGARPAASCARCCSRGAAGSTRCWSSPARRRSRPTPASSSSTTAPTTRSTAILRCPPFAYQPGQALFDPLDPASCVARTTEPFLRPDQAPSSRGRSTTCASPRASCSSRTAGTCTTAWPTPASAWPSPRRSV